MILFGSQFLPQIGNNPEFKKAALSLNTENKFGLSKNDLATHLLVFKQKKLDPSDENKKKEELRQKLFEKLQKFVVGKKLENLRASASIEIINPTFRGVN